jgi:hypothetical protein
VATLSPSRIDVRRTSPAAMLFRIALLMFAPFAAIFFVTTGILR